MANLKSLYNKQYADSLINTGNTNKYIDYLESLKTNLDNANDLNFVNTNIAKLRTESAKEEAKLKYATPEYRNAYKFTRAVEHNYAIYDKNEEGYEQWNNYRKNIARLGSEVDSDGNIKREAKSLLFTFDTDYDYNKFLESTGYNNKTLQDNGVEIGKNGNGRYYINVDKGNSLFFNILKGVNSVDDFNDSATFGEYIGKTATRAYNRLSRLAEVITSPSATAEKAEVADNLLATIISPMSRMLRGVTQGIQAAFVPSPHVAMSGWDENGIKIGDDIYFDKANTLNYKALGDIALGDYKDAKALLDSNQEVETFGNVTLLGYLTANEAAARDRLDRASTTNDQTYYKNWLEEEYRRADEALMSIPLSDYEVFADNEANQVVERVKPEDIIRYQRLIRNTISEGGQTNDGRRVHYQAGYDDNGDLGVYITIADKSDKGTLTDNFELDNTLAARNIFVKGLMMDETQAALNANPAFRATREQRQMIKYGYDYHFSDGSRLISPNNDGAEFVSPDGKNKRFVDRSEMAAILQLNFAKEDIIENYRVGQNAAAATIGALNMVKSQQQAEAFNRAAEATTKAYGGRLNQADLITKCTEVYLDICNRLGLNAE